MCSTVASNHRKIYIYSIKSNTIIFYTSLVPVCRNTFDTSEEGISRIQLSRAMYVCIYVCMEVKPPSSQSIHCLTAKLVQMFFYIGTQVRESTPQHLGVAHVPDAHVPPEVSSVAETPPARDEHDLGLGQDVPAEGLVVDGPAVVAAAREPHEGRGARRGLHPGADAGVVAHEGLEQRQVRAREREVAPQQPAANLRPQREPRHLVVELRHADGGVVARRGQPRHDARVARRRPPHADAC